MDKVLVFGPTRNSSLLRSLTPTLVPRGGDGSIAAAEVIEAEVQASALQRQRHDRKGLRGVIDRKDQLTLMSNPRIK